jgi:hypothetical protein
MIRRPYGVIPERFSMPRHSLNAFNDVFSRLRTNVW